MERELPDLTAIPVERRPPTAYETRLIEFLLRDPFALPELGVQLESAAVVSRCGCGCASVNFEVASTAPRATWDDADTPFGRSGWVPLVANGTDAAGTSVEVTLHVVSGYLGELEIWTGSFAEFVQPDPAALRLDERLPAKTQYALARAVAERLRLHVPADVTLTPTRQGSIEIRAPGLDAEDVQAIGGHERAACALLEGVSWELVDLVEWAGADAHAETAGSDLLLWFGERAQPTLELPPVGPDELERLARLWPR